jgi:signal transduction histidine kinase
LSPAGIERLVFSVVLATVQVGIAVYVYAHTQHRLLKLAFAALGISLAVWTIAIGLAHAPELSSLFVVRLAFSSAAVLVVALLTFVFVFPASALPSNRWYWAFAAIGTALSLLSLSPLVVAHTTSEPQGLAAVYGPVHRIYAAYVFIGIVASFLVLRTKLRSASGRQRLQLRYLALALLVPAVGIATTNLIIPVISGISVWGRYGPVFSLVFLGVTAHAIIRQRLMDVRLVVGQTISYGAAVIVSGVIFALTLFGVAQRSTYVSELPLASLFLAAFGFALMFAPLTRMLRRVFDSYFYREPYDYSATIRQSSLALSSTLDPQQLLKNLFAIIRTSMRPEFLLAYLRDEDRGTFHVVLRDDEDGGEERPAVIEPTEPLVAILARRGAIIFREAGQEPDPRDPTATLTRMRAECACPVIHETQLLAILVLGPKLSGDAYYSQDIDLLSTLAGNVAVAIKNAELYQRVALLEEQRRRTERVAESGALTAGIAHEIKNPLVAIRTFAELLPERYEDEEFRSQFGRVMMTEIARIDKLIDRLRGRGPAQNYDLAPLDVQIPLNEVLSLLSAKFEQAGIRVVRSTEAGSTLINGRLDDLKQLFLNLLMNASEEMAGGGEISIAISRQNSLGHHSVIVDILDEGGGIAEEIEQRLFQPFMSTKHGSSGLGLWLSRRIADAHNATMRGINRRDRKGALFTVEFPAYLQR